MFEVSDSLHVGDGSMMLLFDAILGHQRKFLLVTVIAPGITDVTFLACELSMEPITLHAANSC